MRWVCPRCRRPITLAYSTCPFCSAAEAAGSVGPTASAVRPDSPAVPEEQRAQRPGSPPARAAAPPRPVRRVSRPVARVRRKGSALGGVARLGAGFALVVLGLTLVGTMLWLWLSAQPGWQEWFEQWTR